MSIGLVVQCFVKLDTLQGLCESLLDCARTDELDLIFWSDSAVGNTRGRYAPLNAQVMSFLKDFQARHGARFASVEVKRNDYNKGTCRTCQIAMDYAFSNHELAIFSEDDTIFAKDTFHWFDSAAKSPAFASDRPWAIAGESIFFNGQGRSATNTIIAHARTAVADEQLLHKYIEVDFLPSTCFLTSASKWQQFGRTRGQPLGDEDVNARCKAEDRVCIMPVVPRVKDVGMLHNLGYSVSIHGTSGVSELKNTYLTSDDFADAPFGPLEPTLFEGSKNALYQTFTEFRQFADEFPNTAAAEAPSATETPNDAPEPTPLAPESTRGLLPKTMHMISDYHPGTYVPESDVCFDADEVDELGHLLSRLIYAPSQIRKRLERHGATIAPVGPGAANSSQLDLEKATQDAHIARYGLIFSDQKFLRDWLGELVPMSADFDPPVYQDQQNEAPAFCWENHQFSYSDAMAYYATIRKLKPACVFEVGGGWSTLVASKALKANGTGRIVAVAPAQPELLSGVDVPLVRLADDVRDLSHQDIEQHLSPGDVLHLDGSHALKLGSDTLHLYLQILPRLTTALNIHVHDIKLPFDFSLETMRDHQIIWNEQYLLYAYILGNPKIRVLFGSNYHANKNMDLLNRLMHGRYPAGGASLWFHQDLGGN